ncbi:MAG TPA: ThiF family adenylyltransferase [Thermoanaerobaculia bacterium]|nr:ThiF family adenylyltransferase [Thermoanaerobaculia bacterium]
MEMTFRYQEMVGRNLGFVTEREQELLRSTPVFVCGVGGMGGACLMSLVRAGMETLAIADFDRFEVSNLNRQLFATLRTVGRGKVEGTLAEVAAINPEARLQSFGAEWIDRLDEILAGHKVVVNGTDDIRAAILLYRKAREQGVTVIDAYTSPLPSVTRVRPGDPRPEERLRFPTVGKPWNEISDADIDECKLAELVHVATHSSSARYFDPQIASEVFAGRRSRPSFAPMVITAGNLMAFEVISHVLGRDGGADCRGYFFDPWRGRAEHPRSAWLAALLEPLVRRKLMRLAG